MFKIHHFVAKTLISTLIGLSLFACTDNRPQEQKNKSITIAQFGHVFLYLPLYIADQKGFFEQQGLDVNLVSTGGDDKTFAAVVSGSAQFGVADPAFVAIAKERGQSGKVISSLVNGVTFWGITFDDTITAAESVQELSGKRIAVYTAPSTNYTVMKDIVQKNNLQDVQVVEGSFGSLVAMLRAGDADIAMELEPIVSIANSQGAHVVYSLVDTYGDFAFTGITATDEYLAANPETAQSLVNAIQQALDYVRSDFDGSLQVAQKEFPEVDKAILELALKRLINDGVIPANAALSQSAWKNSISLRKSVGDLQGEGAFEDHVDNSYANKASK